MLGGLTIISAAALAAPEFFDVTTDIVSVQLPANRYSSPANMPHEALIRRHAYAAAVPVLAQQQVAAAAASIEQPGSHAAGGPRSIVHVASPNNGQRGLESQRGKEANRRKKPEKIRCSLQPLWAFALRSRQILGYWLHTTTELEKVFRSGTGRWGE
jgi:hypothetical protein